VDETLTLSTAVEPRLEFRADCLSDVTRRELARVIKRCLDDVTGSFVGKTLYCGKKST